MTNIYEDHLTYSPTCFPSAKFPSVRCLFVFLGWVTPGTPRRLLQFGGTEHLPSFDASLLSCWLGTLYITRNPSNNLTKLVDVVGGRLQSIHLAFGITSLSCIYKTPVDVAAISSLQKIGALTDTGGKYMKCSDAKSLISKWPSKSHVEKTCKFSSCNFVVVYSCDT